MLRLLRTESLIDAPLPPPAAPKPPRRGAVARVAAATALLLGVFQLGVFFGGSHARPPNWCGAISANAPTVATLPAAVPEAEAAPERVRVVASLTTIPQRIDKIRGLLDRLFAQSHPIDRVELNVPYRCLRTNEEYVIPAWLAAMPRVDIHRTADYGAMTKVSPTLLRHADSKDIYVWSVDDDRAYGPDTLAGLVELVPRFPRDVIAHRAHNFSTFMLNYKQSSHRGGKAHARKSSGRASTLAGKPRPPQQLQPATDELDFFEGYGSVLYPPRITGPDFAGFIEKAAGSLDCRKSDDVVLSYYFRSRSHFVKALRRASFEPLDYGLTAQALQKQDDGHPVRYKRVMAWLQANSTLS